MTSVEDRAEVREALAEAVHAVTQAVMTAMAAGVPEGAAHASEGVSEPLCSAYREHGMQCALPEGHEGDHQQRVGFPGMEKISDTIARERAEAERREFSGQFAEPSRVRKALSQMADDEHYAQMRTAGSAHPCEIPGCRISQEEHHRLAYGMIAENREMRRRLREAGLA